MGLLTKLLGLIALGRGMTEKFVLRRVLAGLTVVIALAIVSAMMVGALLIGALYLIVQAFISGGMTEGNAILVTALIAIAITAALIFATVTYLKRLWDIPQQIKSSDLPPTSRMIYQASNMLDGFLEGIIAGKSNRKY